MRKNLILWSIIGFLLGLATKLGVRHLLQIRIPSRLNPDDAPKSEYGLVPAECLGSSLTATGVE